MSLEGLSTRIAAEVSKSAVLFEKQDAAERVEAHVTRKEEADGHKNNMDMEDTTLYVAHLLRRRR